MPNLSAVPPEENTPAADQAPMTSKVRRRRKTAAPEAPAPESPRKTPLVPWPEFARAASIEDIEHRFSSEAVELLRSDTDIARKYLCLALLEPQDSISHFELDQIYNALMRDDAEGKDVLLFLLSPGGSIEPAYQISKLCQMAAKNKFVVVIPRQAKSAATLLALGADEIHMGLLGHLGPIDPQLGGLPALGVSQALETLASLVERYPRSATMFSGYLEKVVTVEQIGYYDRICASAVQYAERLLSNKKSLPKAANEIARELVHEYKDHGFVIDVSEAQQHLGGHWVKTNTPEAYMGEHIYRLYEATNLFLNVYRSKKLWVVGSFVGGVFIFDQPASRRRGA